MNDYLGYQIDERDQTAGDMNAVRADQSEETGEKGAARGAGALRHHAGKFCGLDEQKGRTERECEDCEDQKQRWSPPFGGQYSDTACIARQQQTHRLDENIAEVEELGSSRSARGVARQDRIGREQRREHDHVAEDENPESISDDDSLGRRPAAAAAASERYWNRGWSSLECCCDCHASASPHRVRSICAISAAEISCSRSVLQPAVSTTTAAARKPRI